MPSGYTAEVADGRIKELKDFTLKCAKAFCGFMKEEPPDAAIPEKAPYSDYHQTSLVKSEELKSKLLAMSQEEISARIEEDYAEYLEYYETTKKEKRETKSRYEDMLRKVQLWKIPSLAHENLKNFMIEQLQQSIGFDCSEDYLFEPIKATPEEWRKSQLDAIERSIEYHTEKCLKDKKAAAEMSLWIKELRESL